MIVIDGDDVRGSVHMSLEGYLVPCVERHSYATDEQAEEMLVDEAIKRLISWHKPDLSGCDDADMFRAKPWKKVA